MTKEHFFKIYLTALEKAFNYIKVEDYQSVSPDMFIEDETLRNNIDLFENENYFTYNKLFDLVAMYFDAINHNFQSVNNEKLDTLKKNILNEVEVIKRNLNIKF